MGACHCGKISQQQLDSMKETMNTRNEKIIVDWSKSTYIGGIFGNQIKEGVTCLTNLNLYFVASGWKFEQSLKKMVEVTTATSYQNKNNSDLTVFKVENNQDFAIVFLENKEKLRADCKSLVAEKKRSLVEIEVL